VADFVSKWHVTPGYMDIILPLHSGGVYNFTVDYGDGSGPKTVTAYNDPNATHTYTVAAQYTVIISGTIIGWTFSGNPTNASKFDEILQWGDLRLGNTGRNFYYCSNLQVTAVDPLDLTGTTTLSEMFNFCSGMTSIYAENWDTSSITDMYSVFYHCTSLTSVYISSWDVSNVLDMSWMFMFDLALSTIDLSSWDTGSVTNFGAMFVYCLGIADFSMLENWDTSSATTMWGMFYYTSVSSFSVENWDTSNVTDMNSMFAYCSYLVRVDFLRDWDVSKVTNFSTMFQSCTNLVEIDLRYWDTSSAANMNAMFYYCTSLVAPHCYNFSIRNTTELNRMFYQTNLRTNVYSAILISFAKQVTGIPSTIQWINAIKYYLGRTADARDYLINTVGWSIVDSGDDGVMQSSGKVLCTV